MTLLMLSPVPLTLTVWVLVVWLAERSTPPAARIVIRPPEAVLPSPQPLPEWLHQPGPAAWSAGRTYPNHRIPALAAFPDPPHPTFTRQPEATLTASVAAAWDRWDADRTRRPETVPTVVTWHPGAPVTVEQAA